MWAGDGKVGDKPRSLETLHTEELRWKERSNVKRRGERQRENEKQRKPWKKNFNISRKFPYARNVLLPANWFCLQGEYCYLSCDKNCYLTSEICFKMQVILGVSEEEIILY